jgi:adenylate kinase family enzyme
MGAPGAGVTTLGRVLATHLGVQHMDTDDYHWFTSDPEPYRRRRNPDHRRQLLQADLEQHRASGWILSGSLCGWGDIFVPQFSHVVFCWAPAEVRLERIRKREHARYGAARLSEGGDLAGVYQKFLTWATDYDDPQTTQGRSKQAELAWLRNCNCPTLLLEEVLDVEMSARNVTQWLLSD